MAPFYTDSTRATHTDRGQYNISREYYYETFKPPLSGRISIRCPTTTLTLWIFFFFLRLNPGTRRKFLPHQQGKVCVGFSFLCHIWLRLLCCRLFVSLHCLIQEPPLRQSEQCALYDRLHTFPGLLKVWDNLRGRKSINNNNNNNFNPPVRLSFEEFLDAGQSTHRQTYSDWLWSSWFPPPPPLKQTEPERTHSSSEVKIARQFTSS